MRPLVWMAAHSAAVATHAHEAMLRQHDDGIGERANVKDGVTHGSRERKRERATWSEFKPNGLQSLKGYVCR